MHVIRPTTTLAHLTSALSAFWFIISSSMNKGLREHEL